jgi:hypothetical protein
MPRLINLEDFLFRVDEHPVFVCVAGNSGERRLAVAEKKAIVNRSTKGVLRARCAKVA